MAYETQLHMVLEIFRKCRIQTLLIDPHAPIDEWMSPALRQLLNRKMRLQESFFSHVGELQHNTIYTLSDPFRCRYLFLLLPQTSAARLLLIGPYHSSRPSHQEILEYAEQAGVPPRRIKQLEDYHHDLPYLPEQSHLFAVLDTFAETLWGAGNYTAVDLEKESEGLFSPLEERPGTVPAGEAGWSMQIIEKRYEYENELMQSVSNGQIHKVEILLASLKDLPFERRLSDQVRNVKNYCIIMNTLLRKAAENGGVHPIHLDSVSSGFAQKIEQLTTASAGAELMSELFRSYCLLVRDHSVGQYSALVRRTVACIETDLTADLSLHTLAEMQNVSPSYLSSLFRKEVGQTLTQYVNDKRIRSAKHLLRGTTLQIQTVAQHCGILDVYYFSKLFKRYTGKTPREYRESAVRRRAMGPTAK